ncbi:MAG: glycosyltransferase family 9 protein, partial [Melioribacteraceae bacterium]
EYIFLKKSGRRVDESVVNQIKLIGDLRRRKFDLAINLKWKSERASLISYMSGAKVRAGYKEEKFFNVFTHYVDHPKGRYHEIYRNLDILKAIDLKITRVNPLIHISEDAKNSAENFFTANNLEKDNTICIHPGASKASRAWLPERYAELAKRMIDDYRVKVLITYGSNELELAKWIVDGIGDGAYLSPETQSVSHLAAIIDHCSLFLSVCTGPMNVANAVGTPIIALLGSSDPVDWAPFGKIHTTIKSPLKLAAYTDEDEREALDQISVESVRIVTEKRWREIRNF